MESGRGSEPGPLLTAPTCSWAALALPAPSPLKRGVARSRVVAAMVVVRPPRRRYRVPARAMRKGQLRLQDTSGGSEGPEGKSRRL